MLNNAPSFFVNIERLWKHISFVRRIQFIWLLGLMVATSIFEVVGVGLLLPFLSILLNPETVFNNDMERMHILSDYNEFNNEISRIQTEVREYNLWTGIQFSIH